MLTGILVTGGLGVVLGIFLAAASKIFYVYVDPRIEAVTDALPGANCGGCGLPGCSSNAIAIVEGKASVFSCVVGGPETAAEIAAILGVAVEIKEPDIAHPGCRYGIEEADIKYLYQGINDCRAAALLSGGAKVCSVGCLGLGSCVKACSFGALSMGKDNLPVVNSSLCTGCGACESVCPKHIITLTSNSRRIQHEYTMDECFAPCQRACPAGIDIPSYIFEISKGSYLDAVRIIKESNPFPSVCGRICVHPCESECRRNLVDEPVAINHLKRFASDFEMNSGEHIQVPRSPETEKRVDIVGGGAEGLTAAYGLNRLGHDVTVYEASSQLGGILRIGIPENRLPGKSLDWDINGILDAGVRTNTGQRLGRDFTIESLMENGAHAVFIATGGWDSMLSSCGIGASFQPLPGVMLLLDFVLDHRTGKGTSAGRDVMILDGGKAGLETAENCIKEGVQKVHMVFRANRDRVPFFKEELDNAQQKGIQFYFGNAATKMMGQGHQLTHIEISSILEDDNNSLNNERKIIPRA